MRKLLITLIMASCIYCQTSLSYLGADEKNASVAVNIQPELLSKKAPGHRHSRSQTTSGPSSSIDVGQTSIKGEKFVGTNQESDNDYVGWSVAATDSVTVATAPGTRTAFIYIREIDKWKLHQELPVPYETNSVAIYNDIIVIGSAGYLTYGKFQVFERSGLNWDLKQQITPPSSNPTTYTSVSVSASTMALGSGKAVYVYTRTDGTWTYHQTLNGDSSPSTEFGVSVSVNGDTIAVGQQRSFGVGGVGATYIYVRDGAGWTRQQKLTAGLAGSTAEGADGFGISVSLSSDTLLVGADADDVELNNDQGSVYIFNKISDTWLFQKKLIAKDGATSDRFGRSVFISGDKALVGAPYDDVGENGDQGSVYVFSRSDANWAQTDRIVAEDGAAVDLFGSAVALENHTAIVGAPRDDHPLTAQTDGGSVYVYKLTGGFDFGDAPHPDYPTLLVRDGARHNVGGPGLGAKVDVESDGQPNSGATGDDIFEGDDEDGLDFYDLVAASSGFVDVEVRDGPALLDAWVDFNADGDWADQGEQIFYHRVVTDGINRGLTFDVPGKAILGATYARARISSDGIDDVTGPAPDGEVEDEQVEIGLANLKVFDDGDIELDSSTKNINVRVSLSKKLTEPVFVDYATIDGTAKTGDSDYVGTSGRIVFAPGEINKTISIAVIGDKKYEPAEAFSIVLSNSIGAKIADELAVVTIRNDDARPTVTFSESGLIVSEDVRAVTLTVLLSNPSSEEITVPFTMSGDASADDHSVLSVSPINIPAESNGATITLMITDDALDEASERLTFVLGMPNNAILGTEHTFGLILEDNDPRPSIGFSSSNVAHDEGNREIKSISVCLSSVSGLDVSVHFSRIGSLLDFNIISTSPITIPRGASCASILYNVIDDNVIEGNETVRVNLHDPVNAVLRATDTFEILILDNDNLPNPPSIQFSYSKYEVMEGSPFALITLTRTGIISDSASVFVHCESGSAAEGTDYRGVTQTVQWSAGEIQNKVVRIEIVDDGVFEKKEDLKIVLSEARGASLGTPATAKLTIQDDDPLKSVIEFSNVGSDVGESGKASTFVVNRLKGGSGSASVRVVTRDVSAKSKLDYIPINRTLSWRAGEYGNKSVNIEIVDDGVNEADETAELTLTNVNGAELGNRATAVLKIVDDDPPPGEINIAAVKYSVSEAAGGVTIELTRSRGVGGSAAVLIATRDGTAAAGSDYTATRKIVNWSAGSAAKKKIFIPIRNDGQFERVEEFLIELSKPVGVKIGGRRSAAISIIDDDKKKRKSEH